MKLKTHKPETNSANICDLPDKCYNILQRTPVSQGDEGVVWGGGGRGFLTACTF